VINEEMDADFTILIALHSFLTQDKVTSFSWGVVGDVLLAVCVGPLSIILNVFSERHFDIILRPIERRLCDGYHSLPSTIANSGNQGTCSE